MIHPTKILRGALFASLFTVSPALAAQDEPASQAEIMHMVVEEALATRVPPALALAVARVESNFRPGAESVKGARGVMQIMPATARGEYGVAADELWDPRLNIQLGIDFLERLIDRYEGRWDLALSYYNGGSAVGKLPNARVLPVTRQYVADVLEWHDRYAEQAVVWNGIAAPADPAWLPARTAVPAHTAEVADDVDPLPGGLLTPPSTVHVTVRWIAPSPVPQVLGDSFDERLAAARRHLDGDFDGGLERRLAVARRVLDAGGPVWPRG